MRERQETEREVGIAAHGKTVEVHAHGLGEIAVGEHDTLRFARGTRGVDDAGQVVERKTFGTTCQFGLGSGVSHRKEIGEINRRGIIGGTLHGRVEDDNLFQSGAGRHGFPCIIILILLSHKEITHLGIAHDIFKLFERTGGIQGHDDRPIGIGGKIDHQTFGLVGGVSSYIFLRENPHSHHGPRSLPHSVMKCGPRDGMPHSFGGSIS